MSQSAGIAGGGLVGRMLAYELVGRGWNVSLFDKQHMACAHGCSHASAGMLAPSCELETAEAEVSALGSDSVRLWTELLKKLPNQIYYKNNGSLVVAHPADAHELDRLRRRIRAHPLASKSLEEVGGPRIQEIEPELAGRFVDGLFMPEEAHVDNRAVLHELGREIQHAGVQCRWEEKVVAIKPHSIATHARSTTYDWVFDCRGMGASQDLPELRGVRGEIITISAPEVNLSRPVRLMHPRYAIYVVPRPHHHYLVGATAIESEDYSPISLRSCLELMSAAYSLHPGFAEARLQETTSNCRPSFPDNRPRIFHTDGLIRINGLYRHGFLLSPVLVAAVCEYLESHAVPERAGALFCSDPCEMNA